MASETSAVETSPETIAVSFQKGGQAKHSIR